MKNLPAAVERRPGTTRRVVLSTAAAVALMAAALMTPSVALAGTPTSAPDPYGSTSETSPTSEPDWTSETSSTQETDSTSDTSSTQETDSTSDTSTPETSSTSESAPNRAELAVFDPGPCVGAFVTASGSGFSAGEPIDLLRDGVTVTTVEAAPDGSFSVRVDIAGVQNGQHVIAATGTLSGFTSSGVFDVEPRVCTTDSGTTVVAVVATGSPAVAVVVAGSGTSLATTGFPTVPVLAAAVLALLVGTMLLVATRQRRGVRPSDSPGPRHL